LCCAAAAFAAGLAWADQAQEWPIKPKEMEQAIWAHLQANQDLGFTSIDRVKCNKTDCEIRFTGPDPFTNSDALDRLVTNFMLSTDRRIKIRQASTQRAEVSPGVPGIVIRLSSRQPFPAHDAQPEPKSPPPKLPKD
jgi:hypothetical protein